MSGLQRALAGAFLLALGLMAGCAQPVLSTVFMGLGPSVGERVAVTLREASFAIEA